MIWLTISHALQKKGVLSEAALPEELRLALAQNMQNDLFYQVRTKFWARAMCQMWNGRE